MILKNNCRIALAFLYKNKVESYQRPNVGQV